MAVNPSIQLGTSGNWAIKEDNLLAYKQLGNKFFDREFDFSRGTRATFVGRNGLIQESGLTSAELVTNGDFATDSDWTKGTGWTISGGTANQDGSNGIIRQSNVAPLNTKFKVTFDLTNYNGNGGLTIKLAPTQYDVTLNGNGTYNIFTDGTNTLNDSLQIISSNGFVGSITNVSVKEIQVDVPRIDFTDDPTGHLLLEPQSTNLFTYSNDFSQWGSLSGASVINNVLVSPDGTLNADEFVFDGTSNGRIEKSVPTTNGLDYTFSIYLKNKDIANPTQVFIGTSGGGGEFVTITNGWQRFTTTQIADDTSEYPRVRYNGVGSLYAYGAQFEQQSYATSYIPTSGSAVTRNQELCNNSGTVNDFNSEEGVLYTETACIADLANNRAISVSSDNSNYASIQYNPTSNRILGRYRNAGSFMSQISFDVADRTQFSKIAFRYKQDDFALFVNGVKVATKTSGNVLPADTFTSLNFSTSSSENPFQGKAKCVAVFKEALTDEELQTLTT